MRTYKAEKEAGITFETNAEGSSASSVVAQVRIGDIAKHFDGMSVAELIQSTSTVQTVEELLGQEQPDLALIVAILVSTGWNLNDDVFTPAEVWKARSSPMNKPMNDNHVATKILGHIVQTRALDKFGTEIDLAEGESPPAEFDIEVAGVLYKQFPEMSDRIDEIIAKAKSGEMFVSMEAWFPDFGYGLIDPTTGNTKLIERSEGTAFLTKHLRVYGGSGDYQGYKVGRVLKDIIFGAQGFVDTPANPDSVIKVAAERVAASRVFVTAELSNLPEGGVEDVDEKELKALQAKLEEAQASLESKTKEVADLQATASEVEAKDYDGQLAALNTKVDELTASVTEASEKMVAVEAEKEELQKQLTVATERAEKVEAELTDIRKTEAARERMAKLSEVKKIEDEEATLAELRDMTDETFAMILKYAGETKVEENAEAGTETDETSASEEEAAQAALNNVETDESAEFNASEDVAKTEADKWLSTAAALCGKPGKDEGGE